MMLMLPRTIGSPLNANKTFNKRAKMNTAANKKQSLPSKPFLTNLDTAYAHGRAREATMEMIIIAHPVGPSASCPLIVKSKKYTNMKTGKKQIDVISNANLSPFGNFSPRTIPIIPAAM